MSFEESLKNLTESNERLAKSNLKIAEANEALGEAMNDYANMLRTSIAAVAKDAVSAVGAGSAAAESKKSADKKSADKKSADKKEPEAPPPTDDFGDDGFGDGGDDGDDIKVPDKLDGNIVKEKLLEVRDAYGDKAPALKIIKTYGYNAIPDVKPADYENVYKDACRAIKAAPKSK